jgi:hypothetical protein
MPRVKWNGTGIRYIEVPVPPRGLVELQPGWNLVTDAELTAMTPHIQLELAAGNIVIDQQLSDSVPAPGVVESFGEAEQQADEVAAATFAVDDRVVSKSGGPVMWVDVINADGTLHCSCMIAGQIIEGDFPAATLELAPSA